MSTSNTLIKDDTKESGISEVDTTSVLMRPKIDEDAREEKIPSYLNSDWGTRWT